MPCGLQNSSGLVFCYCLAPWAVDGHVCGWEIHSFSGCLGPARATFWVGWPSCSQPPPPFCDLSWIAWEECALIISFRGHYWNGAAWPHFWQGCSKRKSQANLPFSTPSSPDYFNMIIIDPILPPLSSPLKSLAKEGRGRLLIIIILIKDRCQIAKKGNPCRTPRTPTRVCGTRAPPPKPRCFYRRITQNI